MGDKIDKAVNKKFVNPYRFKDDDLPLIVLSTHSSGFIQWLIKFKTKSNWNHIMLQLNKGRFVSQGNTFSSIPLDRYMTKYSRLKFWRIKELPFSQKNKLADLVNKDLKSPWWKRRYDYLGIIGQAIGIKQVNNPNTMYCSERVAKYLRKILDGIPAHPSPEDLNKIFKKHKRFEVAGYWWAD